MALSQALHLSGPGFLSGKAGVKPSVRSHSRGWGASHLFPAERGYPKSGDSLRASGPSRPALTFLKADPSRQGPCGNAPLYLPTLHPPNSLTRILVTGLSILICDHIPVALSVHVKHVHGKETVTPSQPSPSALLGVEQVFPTVLTLSSHLN